MVASELCSESVDYRNLKPENEICIVLGNERNGVAYEILSICDSIVYLPMHGMNNSLNVSVVAGILGFII